MHLHEKLHGKCYGTTTMGERGQIVIPAKAREELQLKNGDKLLVFGRFGKFLGLIKAKDFDNFIDKITNKMAQGIKKLKKFGKNYGKNH